MPRLTTRPPRMYRDRGRAYVKIDGQRVGLGPWASAEARETYDRLIAEWLANGRKLPEPTDADEPVTVTEVCVEYVKHARQKRDARDVDHIEPALRIARQLYGSEPAESFGPKRLRIVRQQMIDKGLARSTINKRVKWVRAAFRWAASHELVSERIHRRLDTVEPLRRGDGGRETERVKPVPRPDIRRTRRLVPQPVRGLIDLQLLTGARADELVRLRAVDIDMSDQVWIYRPENHKTAYAGKTRMIYFGPRARRLLQQFILLRPLDAPIFSPKQANSEAARRRGSKGRRPNQKPNPKKSDRTLGDGYTTASYGRAIRNACKRAKVDTWGPHRLRHNAATFLRREFGIEVASIILGHSSLAITQTYAEQDEKKAREVIAKVG
ncbi:MAG: site-specific integrase [Phycisphaeraceae bacterium]